MVIILFKKEIFIVSHTGIYGGGAERCLYYFLKYTKIPKDKFLVVIPFYEKGGLADKIRELNVDYVVLYKGNDRTPLKKYIFSPRILFKRMLNRIKYAFRLMRLIKKYKPRLIYLNTIRCGTELIISKMLGIKSILHIHGLDNNWKLRLPLIKYLPYKILTVAQSEKEILKKVPVIKVLAVTNNGSERT